MAIIYFNLSAPSSVSVWTISFPLSYLDDTTTVVLEVKESIAFLTNHNISI